jgi:predicted dienelactone hydrolase
VTGYDPFAPGPHAIVERAFEARDAARSRAFPCAVWHPQEPGAYPLILFSHASGHHRRGATFLTTHLASHGYVVAALDHSEVVAPELRAKPGETSGQKAARWQAIIDARVPDARFLLDHMLAHWDASARVDASRIGIAGHSFGGWTALAALDTEPRIGAVVALAPGGASTRKPGILPCTLDFDWRRAAPTLILAAEADASLPLEGMIEIFTRTPSAKRMFVLRRADHLHFMDNARAVHEDFRTMEAGGDIAEMQKAMRPFDALCGEQEAQAFARGLATAHLDAVLQRRPNAAALLEDAAREFSRRGIDAYEFKGEGR